MIRSIKYFLLVSLLLGITIASAINGVGNFILDEQVIQPYLDGQLVRIASLINILEQSTSTNSEIRNRIITYLRQDQPITKQKFTYQVWNQDGKLLMTSSTDENAINILKEAPVGFSNHVISGDLWRVYTTIDAKTRYKIIIAELYNIRRNLADDIARNNANILLITYPAFGLLVWFIINMALRSMTRVAKEISDRAFTYLEPMELDELPIEIKPLVAELNNLFFRLKLAFERNKRFAADAAHELRTPLAALKTHVQVALKSDNETDRNNALQKVIESVDRSSHVVAQLLTLSRLGEEEKLSDVRPLDLHKLATEILAYLAAHALEKNIDIELLPPPASPYVMGNDTALGILIRNLVDNAIRYTPPNGEVKVCIVNTAVHTIFRVTDTGPGIPPELRERVFERFYRILGSKASGSGLGLAIVSQISALHHATIKLSSSAHGKGLQIDVAFPRYPA